MGFRLANIAGRAALVSGDNYFDLATISDGSFGSDPMAALHRPDELAALSATLGSHEPGGVLADAELGPPVPRPQKSFAIGLNYQAHADEGAAEVPDVPLVFSKFPSCLVGPTADVHLRSDRCDYEGELVVVIGTEGKDIDPAEAWDHVLGVTIGQDISDREMQFAADPMHWDLGKSFDTFGPIGPVLVSVDELADRDALQVTTRVNGEVVQDDSTANLMFDVPTLVSYISRVTTLVPGDVIFTGTPEGVGVAQNRFLNDGDVITTTISGLGQIENRCRRVGDFDADGISGYKVDKMIAARRAAATAPPKIAGDEYLARTLAGYGVTHFFYTPLIVPSAMKIMELPEYGIQCVSAHAEKAAGFMADGYARVSGRPGLCGAQGIGRGNLMSGLRDATMASSPIIAISGGHSNADENEGRDPYQEVDDFASFDAYTKFNASVRSLDRLPDMLRQAFREATSGRPAPVHLHFPGVIGQVTVGEMDDDKVIESRFASVPSFRSPAQADDLAAAIAALRAAERPIIVAGAGVTRSGAKAELCEFARKHQIPVATSMSGKDVIPTDDPLSVGVVGLYGKQTATTAVAEADLVFYVGCRTAGQATDHWESPARGTNVIQLDIDPHWLGRNYPNIASLCGDAKAVLGQLLDGFEAMEPRQSWVERVAAINEAWSATFAAVRASDAMPIRPERLVAELSSYLPDDAIVVSCTGHASTWTAQFLELTSPNQTYIRAAGTLGWGFPAALGAKCAAPDRPVFCFTGDGGMYYHLTELETAARYGINTVTVVNNNSSLNQATPVWASSAADEERLRHHWRFADVNFANLAEEMGCFGIRVTDPSELAGALDKAVASGRPAVVEVVTGLDAVPPADAAAALLSDVGKATS